MTTANKAADVMEKVCDNPVWEFVNGPTFKCFKTFIDRSAGTGPWWCIAGLPYDSGFRSSWVEVQVFNSVRQRVLSEGLTK
jgi:hypothetical protein